MGAFFWGYIVSQIPAGWLAGRIGGAKVMGYFLLLMSICNVLMPAAARLNFWLLMVLRVLSGIGSVSKLLLFCWVFRVYLNVGSSGVGACGLGA